MANESSISQQELVLLLKQAIETSVLAEKIERHEHILMGNGQEGMVVRFRVLEENMETDFTQIKNQIKLLQDDLKTINEWKGTVIRKLAMVTGGVSVASAVISAIILNPDRILGLIKLIAGH